MGPWAYAELSVRSGPTIVLVTQVRKFPSLNQSMFLKKNQIASAKLEFLNQIMDMVIMFLYININKTRSVEKEPTANPAPSYPLASSILGPLFWAKTNLGPGFFPEEEHATLNDFSGNCMHKSPEGDQAT